MAEPMDFDDSTRNPVMDRLIIRKLSDIRPRVKDRTETQWWSCEKVSETDSLADAFDKLTDNNISSLPVVDRNGKVSGIVELSTIVDWITGKLSYDPSTAALSDVLEARQEMRTVRVSSVMDTWNYYTARDNFSLHYAAEMMARNSAKRVIVTNWQDKPRGIFTQSMLIGEVYNNLNILPDAIKNMKVRNMTKTYWVDTILEDSTAIAAFRRLNNYGRAGMAVVNNEGAVIDELSEKDLKGLNTTSESFLNLYKTVKEFKKIVREKSRKPIPEVATVTQQSTFEDVIRLMDQNPTARVFVVAPKTKRPLYTLTQTDVIKMMFPHANW